MSVFFYYAAPTIQNTVIYTLSETKTVLRYFVKAGYKLPL